MSSTTPTPWAVRCPKHGQVYLTEDEYKEQVTRGGGWWQCTREVVRYAGTIMQLTDPCGEACETEPQPEFDSAGPSYTGPFVGPVELPDDSGRTLASGPAIAERDRIMRERLGFPPRQVQAVRILPPNPRGPVFFIEAGGERAEISPVTGRLFMQDETGALVESYDWARFGKIAYRAVTNGKEPPTTEGGNDHG